MTLQWEAQVVGINYYPKFTKLLSLTAAASDAEAVAIQLETYGYPTFRVQRLPRQANQKGEWQIDPKEGIKSQELQEAIAKLFNPPDGQAPETALFFFSGHGWRRTVNGKEEVFLATSDVFPDEGIYGVPLSWLGEQLKVSPSKQLIVWLDCCYSGELLKYIPTNKDYCIITATRSYEPGIEIAYQEGLFTQALREGLNPDNYPDGIVDSHNLAQFLKDRMPQTLQAPRFANSERSILLTTKSNRKNFQDRCPYRSLSFFSEKPEDAQVFHGRTELTRQLVERVREKQRLIAIFGASGSGKSSLIRAGLLYKLKLGQSVAGSNNWTYLEPFTPTDEPLQRLSEVGPFAPTNDRPIILTIDQFEECFTMCEEEKRKAFIDRLTELFKSIANLQIIIGMRDDFRGRLREFSEFAKQMSKVNVGYLNHEEIREAIEKPAEWVGLGIGEGLKQQLINDVEDYPGSLPLLQYTLTELWNEARKQGERFLRLETYQELGGIEGTLEKRADAVYESLSEEEKSVAKRIFLELTQVGDTLDTRRRVRLGDLVNSHHSLEILDRVTLKLANEQNRLITRTEMDEEVSQGKSQILIDVVHEALIRNWNLLGQWKEKYQAAMVIERRIEALAQDWEKEGRKNEDLLQESRLATAEGYLKSFSKLGMLDGMAEEFIAKSRNLRDDLKREKEESQQRELENLEARRQAEEKARLEAEKRSQEIAKEKQKTEEALKLADIGQIEALVSSSNALFKSDETFDSLLTAVQGASKFQRFTTLKINDREQSKIELFEKVYYVLQQSVYGIQERKIKHDNPVFSVVFSPDGEMIATNDAQGIVRLWTKTGKLFKTLSNFVADGESSPYANGMSIAFSSDSQMIAFCGIDKIVRVWNTKDNSLREFKGHNTLVSSVSFRSDNKILASISIQGGGNISIQGGGNIENNFGKVNLWNLEDGQLIKTFQAYDGDHFVVSFSPNKKMIATGGWDNPPWQGKIKLWDIQGNLRQTFAVDTGFLRSIQFSRDGQKIICAGDTGKVLLLDIASGDILTEIIANNLNHWTMGAKLSPDGQVIASIDAGGSVKLWNLEGNLIKELHEHHDTVYGLNFSPDGKILATSSADRIVQLHKLENDFLKSIEIQKNSSHYGITFSPKGDNFASASWNPAIQEWVVKLWSKEGKLLKTFPDDSDRDRTHHYGDIIKNIQFSPDGQLIGTASWDGTVKIWTIDGKLLKNFTEHQRPVNGLSFSPDGKMIVSGGYGDEKGNFWMLWDLKGQERKVSGHSDQIYRIAFSPDGKMVATGSWDRTIKLWNVIDGKLIRTLDEKHNSWILGLGFSPNGRMLVSSSKDKTVKLWSIDGNLLHTLIDHKGEVNNVAFSPDGKIIASASNDRTIKLWSTDGILLRTLRGHTEAVYGLSFNPNGKTLVSASWDGSIKVWSTETLDFNGLLEHGCTWIPEYLKTSLNEQNPGQPICNQK